jgi:hypothetical protein
VAQALPIYIRGEAYSVAVDVRFPQPGLTGLDYGTVRVSESPSQAVALKNVGKYPVAFKVDVRQGLAAELLGVVPEDGAIEPGKEVTLQVGCACCCCVCVCWAAAADASAAAEADASAAAAPGECRCIGRWDQSWWLNGCTYYCCTLFTKLLALCAPR